MELILAEGPTQWNSAGDSTGPPFPYPCGSKVTAKFEERRTATRCFPYEDTLRTYASLSLRWAAMQYSAPVPHLAWAWLAARASQSVRALQACLEVCLMLFVCQTTGAGDTLQKLPTRWSFHWRPRGQWSSTGFEPSYTSSAGSSAGNVTRRNLGNLVSHPRFHPPMETGCEA